MFNFNWCVVGLLLLLFSCSPFVNKELRQKKRANRKLERLIKKYPDLIKKDTIYQNVAFEVPKVYIDTFLTFKFDTVREWKTFEDTLYMTKTIYPKIDTIRHTIDEFNFMFWLNGSKLNYNVFRPSKIDSLRVVTPITKVEAIQLSIWERFLIALNQYYNRLLIILVIILLLYIGKKFLFK